jgi:hypothetical protein
MYRRLALAAIAVTFATPTFAAYYIAQSALDKSCSVVSRMPDGTKQLKVGERSFDSQEEALQGMMIAPECKP